MKSFFYGSVDATWSCVDAVWSRLSWRFVKISKRGHVGGLCDVVASCFKKHFFPPFVEKNVTSEKERLLPPVCAQSIHRFIYFCCSLLPASSHQMCSIGRAASWFQSLVIVFFSCKTSPPAAFSSLGTSFILALMQCSPSCRPLCTFTLAAYFFLHTCPAGYSIVFNVAHGVSTLVASDLNSPRSFIHTGYFYLQ